MAFNITLLYTPTGADHVDKDVETITTITGTLKENVSILDPVILVESIENYFFGYTDENQVYHHGCNYFYIPKFKRHYYLVNLVALETGLYEIYGHVDVLMSHHVDIRSQTAIIRRQETASAYNLYINDNSLKAYQDPYIITKRFPNGFNGFSYVLALAGVRGATPIEAPGAINDLAYTVSTGTLPNTRNFVFTWSAPTNVLFYALYSQHSNLGWNLVADSLTSTTYNLNDFLVASIIYQFKIVAYNDYGTTDSNIVLYNGGVV